MVDFSNITQVDLHTHILPGIDDGAKNEMTSLEMLRKERADGINTVVLSPHFYLFNESLDAFLGRRAESFKKLKAAARLEEPFLPEMRLGAEVYYTPSLADLDLKALCVENTDYMLLELPYEEFTASFLTAFRCFLKSIQVTPVLVHIERYMKFNSPEMIFRVMDVCPLCQMNCASLCGGIGDLITGKRHFLLEMIRAARVHFLGSDTHNMKSRPPLMAKARKIIMSHLSPEDYVRLMNNGVTLLKNMTVL